ncbi:hypothetical protein ACKI14_44965 [Streptomyces turgidiscabies]|uniref:hypothetical protein n=1 Tax=Streptomyces turgidiscabies TaxID=85558 RepID=UPI0038F7AAD0
MQTNGAGQEQRGHVLLVAGDVAARRRTVQVEPSANLAALSIVPVPVLLASNAPADTTYLDGIRDQQVLLMKLRTAAATPGPLLVYLSGRLTVDRRGHQPYLALPHTTASTIRYTALPWEWLGAELRHRPAGLTTVLVDLAADKHAWPHLQDPGVLATPPATEVYGVIAPPGYAGSDGVSTYTRTFVEQLRLNPHRPPNPRLHALTMGAAALPPGALVLPHTPEITAPQAEHRPPQTNLQRLRASPGPLAQVRRRSRKQEEEHDEVMPGLDQRPVPPEQPVPALQAPSPEPVPPPRAPVAQPSVQQQAPRPVPVPPTAPPAFRSAHDDVAHHRQGAEPAVARVRAPHPGPTAPSTPAARQIVPAQYQAPAPQNDPRPHIHALAQQGRFLEAMQLAQVWEQHSLNTHGVNSPEATQWIEIRADLAKMQGNWVLATQLWIVAGRTRLAHQAPDAPEIVAAATSAHYCWTQLPDPRPAIECGPDLVALLRAVPALDRRHVSMAQQRLEFLHAAPGGR